MCGTSGCSSRCLPHGMIWLDLPNSLCVSCQVSIQIKHQFQALRKNRSPYYNKLCTQIFTAASLRRTGHFIQSQLAWIIEENRHTYKENAQRQASSVACKRIPWKPSRRKQTNIPHYMQTASRPIFMVLHWRPLKRHSSYFNWSVAPVLWVILLRSVNMPRRPVSISAGGARSQITTSIPDSKWLSLLHTFLGSDIHYLTNGFGGLGVACWPLVPKFAGSNPAEAVGFLRAKKSSARLP